LKCLLAQVFLITVLCPTVLADLQLVPTSLDLNVIGWEQQVITINVTNNHNFDIFNVKFSSVDDFNFPQISEIKVGESKLANIAVLSSTAYTKDINTIVSFEYKVEVTQNVTSQLVVINESGFNPPVVSIKQGGSINWTNEDTISHTVTSTLFDENLAPGSSFSFTFTDPQVLPYTDQINNYQGTVEVQNITEKELVHSSQYDKPLGIKITSILRETTISGLNFENEFTAPNGKVVSGALKLTNTGSKTAVNISLDMIFATFNKNNFNIDPGQEEIVVYSIQPILDDSNDTNKTYNLTLDVIPLNADPLQFNITLFVPFEDQANITDGLDPDTAAYFQAKREFCEAFPDSKSCRLDPIIKEIEVPVYLDRPIPYNYSQNDINTMIRDYQTIKDQIQQMSNFFKKQTDDVASKVSKLDGLQHQLIDLAQDLNSKQDKELEEAQANRTKINTAFGLVAVVMIGILLAFLGYKIINQGRTNDSINS